MCRNMKNVPLFGENATHPYTNAPDKAALHATLNFNLLRRALYYPSTKFRRKQMDNLRSRAVFSKKQKNRIYRVYIVVIKKQNYRESLNLITRLFNSSPYFSREKIISLGREWWILFIGNCILLFITITTKNWKMGKVEMYTENLIPRINIYDFIKR